MPVYNKRGILLLPKVIVLNPKDGYRVNEKCCLWVFPGNTHKMCSGTSCKEKQIDLYIPCPLQEIKDPANVGPLKAFSFSSEEPIRFEVIA